MTSIKAKEIVNWILIFIVIVITVSMMTSGGTTTESFQSTHDDDVNPIDLTINPTPAKVGQQTNISVTSYDSTGNVDSEYAGVVQAYNDKSIRKEGQNASRFTVEANGDYDGAPITIDYTPSEDISGVMGISIPINYEDFPGDGPPLNVGDNDDSYYSAEVITDIVNSDGTTDPISSNNYDYRHDHLHYWSMKENMYFFPFSAGVTIDTGNTNDDAQQSITLQAGQTYRFGLDVTYAEDITVDHSERNYYNFDVFVGDDNDTDVSNFKIDGVKQTNKMMSFNLLRGQSLGYQSYQADASNPMKFNYTPQRPGYHTIMVQAGDPFTGPYWQEPARFERIYVEGSTESQTIEAADVEGTISEVTLSANVFGGTVSDQEIDFFYVKNGTNMQEEYLGSATTDTNGLATLTSSLDSKGDYMYTTKISGTTIADTANLHIDKIPIDLREYQATGEYQSKSPTETDITISGYLYEAGTSNQLADLSVHVYKNQTLIGSDVTSSDGLFSVSDVTTNGVGNYSDVYNITVENDDYMIQTGGFVEDQIVEKGKSVVNISEYLETYYNDQPNNISGSVTNIHGTGLSTGNIYVDYYNKTNSKWTRVNSEAITNDGNFTLEIAKSEHLGNKTYRIFYDGNDLYLSGTSEYQYGINTNQIKIQGYTYSDVDTDGKNIVPKHYANNASVWVTDESGHPIADLTLDWYAYHYDLAEWYHMGSVVTNSSGYAKNWWVVDGGYYKAEYTQYIIYNVSTTNLPHGYEPVDEAKTFMRTNLGKINHSVSVENSIYDEQSTIRIESWVKGLDIHPDDFNWSVTIEGVTQEYRMTNGIIEIPYTFSLIGETQINVSSITDVVNDYEEETGSTTITIKKNNYDLFVDPINASRGEYVTLFGRLVDVSGDPIDDKNVKVEIFNGQIWENMGNITSQQGNLSKRVLIDQPLGLHDIRFSVLEDTFYHGDQQINDLSVEKELPGLNFEVMPDSYEYGSDTGREVEVKAVINGTSEVMNDLVLAAQFSDYTWTRTTDNNGIISFQLPSTIDPGTYQLWVNNTANSQLEYAEIKSDITINGAETNISWTTTPVDTYYGQELFVGVLAQDSQGTGLDGFEVELIVGSHSIIKQLNATGHANWTVELREQLTDNLEVKVKLHQNGGYNPDEVNSFIAHQKTDLHINLSIPESKNQVLYATETEFNYYIFWSDGTSTFLESNVDVSIYVYNYSELNYELFAIYNDTAANSSWVIKMPEIDAGNKLKLRIQLDHSDYLDSQISSEFDIVKNPISTTEEIRGEYADDQYEITIHVNDVKNNSIEGLEVRLVYYEEGTVSPVYDQAELTDRSGNVIFIFDAYRYGEFTLSYDIIDRENNYDTGSSKEIIINPKPRILTINSALIVTDGGLSLNYTLIDQNGTDLTGQILIDIHYNNSGWEFITTDDTGSFTLTDPQEGIYRVWFAGDEIYSASNSTNEVVFENLNVTTTDQVVQSEMELSLNMNVTGSYGVEGLIVNMYVYNSSISGWTWVAGFSVNSDGTGTNESRIMLTPGEYDISLNINQQSVYNEYFVTKKLTVEKRDTNIETEGSIGLYRNVSKEIVANITDNRGRGIQSASVELWYNSTDNGWQLLATDITDENGTAYFTISIDEEIGHYKLKFVVLQDVKNTANERIQTFSVWQQATISVSQNEVIYYEDGGTLLVNVTDAENGSPIADFGLNVYWKEFLSYDLLASGTTNASGIALINVSPDAVGTFDIKVSAQRSDIYGDVELIGNITVSADLVQINHKINDNGITNNKTVIVWITNDHGNLTTGDIVWTILTEKGGEYNTKTISLNTGTIFIEIPGSLVGNYSLLLQYQENNGNYVAESIVSIQDIGFEQLSFVDITLNQHIFGYDENKTVTIQVSNNQNIINGLDVEVYLNGSKIGTGTTTNGQFEIYLGTIEPGTYNLTLIGLKGSILIQNVDIEKQFEVNLATKKFNVELSDQIYFDEEVMININDLFNSTSTYYVQIRQNGSLIYTGSISNTTLILSSLDLNVGIYNVSITRTRVNFVEISSSQTFEVVPVPVNIQVSYEQIKDENKIEFTLTTTDNRFDTLLQNKNYSIIVNYGNNKTQFIVTGELFSIPVNGTTGVLTVKITILGNYQGETKLTINYNMDDNLQDKTTSESVTQSNTKVQNSSRSENNQSIGQFEEAATILGVTILLGGGQLILRYAKNEN